MREVELARDDVCRQKPPHFSVDRQTRENIPAGVEAFQGLIDRECGKCEVNLGSRILTTDWD